jgi:hypothetical protein
VNLLPTFDACLQRVAAAERGDGWLVACEEAGLYLAICRELVDALSAVLQPDDAEPILEVCAGTGALAAALRAAGVPVLATDSNPAGGFPVVRADAGESLQRYLTRKVVSVFAPIDSGVDQLVMSFPTVREYVVLGARIGGQFGSFTLWSDSSWTRTPLTDVTRWMIPRHDVVLPSNDRSPRIIQHGEAWQFLRS